MFNRGEALNKFFERSTSKSSHCHSARRNFDIPPRRWQVTDAVDFSCCNLNLETGDYDKMVNFAELKAKAEKVKDASVTKVTDTRDKYSSVPSSKTNWDPNWKRSPPPPAASSRTSPGVSSRSPGPPPPPQRSRLDVSEGGAPPPPPAVPWTSRPLDASAAPAYTPLPPPTRSASGYPPSQSQDKIDWTNLSQEDKEAFFDWLDEFFSRYLSIELGPRPSAPAAMSPPRVNMATRPTLS